MNLCPRQRIGTCLFVSMLMLQAACDPFRIRLTDVTSRATTDAHLTFEQVVEVTNLVAAERGFHAENCSPNLGEPCRAFKGSVSLEIYPAGAGTRIRVVETSAFSVGETIDQEIIRRLKERFGHESVEITKVR